jgi:hypothetical protein
MHTNCYFYIFFYIFYIFYINEIITVPFPVPRFLIEAGRLVWAAQVQSQQANNVARARSSRGVEK